MNGGARLGYEGHQFLLFLYVGIVTGPPKHYPDEAGTVTCNVRPSVPAAWLVRAFKSRLVSDWAVEPRRAGSRGPRETLDVKRISQRSLRQVRRQFTPRPRRGVRRLGRRLCATEVGGGEVVH